MIVESESHAGLNTKVNEAIDKGFKPKGSHKVLTRFINVERAGTIHRYDNRYSQTMVFKPDFSEVD